jgi:CRISPR system Cascade subunit CasE
MADLYLSRIRLREGAEHAEAFWRREHQREGDALHRQVWGFFHEEEQTRDFLYRVEGSGIGRTIYTLSRRPPEDRSGLWSLEPPRRFAPQLRAGQVLEFSLRANPVRRSVEGAPLQDQAPGEPRARWSEAQRAARSSDRKHDIVMLERRRLQQAGLPVPLEPELVQEQGERWLAKQGQAAGFGVLRVRADGYEQHRVWRRRPPSAAFSSVEFSGLLEITDPARMIEKLWAGPQPGLGSARGFGCGLVLVRRPGALLRATPGDDEDEE